MVGVDGAILGHVNALGAGQDEVLTFGVGHVAVQTVVAGSHHPAPTHVLDIVVVAESGGTDIDVLLSESGHAHAADNHQKSQNEGYDFFHEITSLFFRQSHMFFDKVKHILTLYEVLVN